MSLQVFLCTVNEFFVFKLPGRMGDLKKALSLITTQLKDVDQAIAFCKDKNDEELWADLIKFSIDKPCK